MRGLVHSHESFGTVDGPGVRYVLFLSGCPMRCRYCHNPDTWASPAAEELSVEEILAEYRKNRAFYEKGGITVTGGEPLCQIDFVTELFEAAQKEGIHTCLDTSGATFCAERAEAFERLLKATSLVLLDIKHMDTEQHRALTGHGNEHILDFARFLDAHGTPVWIRHVLVPTLTDSTEHLTALGRFLASLSCVKALDILPYHTMGRTKYEALGLAYPLPNVPEATKDDVARARTVILTAMKQTSP